MQLIILIILSGNRVGSRNQPAVAAKTHFNYCDGTLSRPVPAQTDPFVFTKLQPIVNNYSLTLEHAAIRTHI
jgi:hypothetical protein